jgi:exodeoxyribonuclease VII large subunit
VIDLLALHPFGPLTMSVSEATAHVKELLDDDPTLADLWVRGEVTDARTYASGHTYFSLRDGESQIRCVLFRQKARRRGKPLEPLENGRQYLVRGAVSVYAASGTYQLYVSDHRPLGAGELYLQFEETRARLEAEGLFAPERKRPLPRWPRRIGIATSPNGAVLHDLRQVIGRRFPLVELFLAPCQVQGADAVRSVVASLRTLDEAGTDVVVVARGGGSIEDLWAFNHEAVARAIAAVSVPVVSAIGHETDFTIADFVADQRAPTPSAAAELMVPDGVALVEGVEDLRRRAERALKAQLWVAQNARLGLQPRLGRAGAARLARAEGRLAALEGRLESLSPRRVLERGYAVVREEATGAVVRHAGQVAPGDDLTVLLAHGALRATVLPNRVSGGDAR